MKKYNNDYSTTKKQAHTTNNQYFKAEVTEKEISENSLIFAFIDAKLLLINNEVPSYKEVINLDLNFTYLRFIGNIGGTSCFAIDANYGEKYLSSFKFVALRQLYSLLPEYHLNATIYGFQIILWNRKNKYCGRCGSPTEENLRNTLVKFCSNCNEEYYPKISPSVIVAVIKDNEILLAQHKRVTNGMFTVLAGFVNPGESLEDCIHREIKEETGIEITNIRYFGSQPWPFPDSLMIGFIADYAKGELKPDKEEITELKWFKPNEIPEWPDKVSIARALIDYFIENT